MARTLRSLSPLLALAALLALTAVPAMAKDGAVAKLDTAVHRDAQPGSTIEIGWSVVQVSNDQETPFSATGFYVRLTSPDGSSNEAPGTETPSGSGHYVATITVPRGGIQDITVALAGTACYASGGCQRADYTFPLTDDRLVSGYPRAAAPTNTAATGGPTAGGELLPLVAIGTAVAVAGGLVALIAGRRRSLRTDAIGR